MNSSGGTAEGSYPIAAIFSLRKRPNPTDDSRWPPQAARSLPRYLGARSLAACSAELHHQLGRDPFALKCRNWCAGYGRLKGWDAESPVGGQLIFWEGQHEGSAPLRKLPIKALHDKMHGEGFRKLVVAVVRPVGSARSWCATMHPAAPFPGPTGTALSGHRQLLRAVAGWLGGHDAPRSSGGRAHHALYRLASLARCRASNCASAFAMAR